MTARTFCRNLLSAEGTRLREQTRTIRGYKRKSMCTCSKRLPATDALNAQNSSVNNCCFLETVLLTATIRCVVNTSLLLNQRKHRTLRLKDQDFSLDDVVFLLRTPSMYYSLRYNTPSIPWPTPKVRVCSHKNTTRNC